MKLTHMTNKKILSEYFLVLVGALFYANSYAAAWLQPKGTLLTILNNQAYNSCSFWNSEGHLQKGPCFFQYSLAPYFEYGVLEKLTLILNPVFDTFNQSAQSVPFGFENIFFGGRYSLWKKDWSQFALQIGYNQPIRTSLFGDSPTSVYAIINRMRYLDARLLYGTGGALDKYKSSTWYIDAEFAYQPSFSGAADEYRFNFMAGIKTLNERLVFELQEWNAISGHNAVSPSLPNYDIATVMGDIMYWIIPNIFSIQFGLQQDFYGVNIGRGTAPFISLWWRYS